MSRVSRSSKGAHETVFSAGTNSAHEIFFSAKTARE